MAIDFREHYGGVNVDLTPLALIDEDPLTSPSFVFAFLAIPTRRCRLVCVVLGC